MLTLNTNRRERCDIIAGYRVPGEGAPVVRQLASDCNALEDELHLRDQFIEVLKNRLKELDVPPTVSRGL